MSTKLTLEEKIEVARVMATGEITAQEVALARRTIHGAETDEEHPRGCLLMEDLSYYWMDDIESYRRVMRVHEVRAGEVQFRFVGSPGNGGLPATLRIIEHIRRKEGGSKC